MSMICQDLRMWQKFRNKQEMHNLYSTRLKERYTFSCSFTREYGLQSGSFDGYVATGPWEGLYKIELASFGFTTSIPVC